MTYHVEVQSDIDVSERVNEALVTAVSSTLSQQSYPPVTVTLLLTDDLRIQQLNRDFRGINQPTDVLSFPAGEPFAGGQEEAPYLGDIVIALPYAKKQAVASEHTLAAELQLLAVHGVLHLIGYDHQQILAQLGLHDIIPTEN
jgi:rRNA maturation RNase YbeY